MGKGHVQQISVPDQAGRYTGAWPVDPESFYESIPEVNYSREDYNRKPEDIIEGLRKSVER